MSSDFNAALGERLRAARRACGLSLLEVESVSGGEFKASVVGAYERGERALSVQRLMGLASLYGVNAADLLGGVSAPPGTILDLDQIASSPDSELVERFLTTIREMRKRRPSEMAIRRSDLAVLASMIERETTGSRS